MIENVTIVISDPFKTTQYVAGAVLVSRLTSTHLPRRYKEAKVQGLPRCLFGKTAFREALFPLAIVLKVLFLTTLKLHTPS